VNDIGIDLYFSREYLKPAIIISLLSVWVLVGLFYYLNRYTKRRYFTTWTVAWMFYAVWLTLSLSLQNAPDRPMLVMFKHWCICISAVFLLWGSARFLNQAVRQIEVALFMGFLLVWSFVTSFYLDDSLQAQLPIFGLICLTSLITSFCFLQFRLRQPYIGSGLLSVGFFLWAVYMAAYPFIQASEYLITAGYFISAVVQLFIAVSMIVLVLEEARTRNELALQQMRAHKSETEVLQSRIASTEERYRSLFDQASEGIVIAGTEDMRVLELNQTARRLLGVSRMDSVPQPLSTFMELGDGKAKPADGPEWFSALRQSRQLKIIRRDGSSTPAEVDGAVIKFDGRPAYQFFIRELTERTRLEQQLRQAEKLSALGQLISGVAHELNNPLAVIKGYLELVLARHDINNQTRTDLEKVASEANRAAKLVNNFLSFAREQPAQQRMTNLNELIQRVAELRRFDLRVASVDLIFELDPDLPNTLADADQMQQVLVNLVTNAIHALVEVPMPRRLLITSSLQNGNVLLSVQDNGPGVPAEYIARIFEPFFTTKEVGTGTGLGLSIAHSILADHQGRIYYEDATGGGARFVMEIPVRQGPETAPEEPVKEEKEKVRGNVKNAENVRILILDDERAIAELLGEMLGLLGYQAELCHNGQQALNVIEGEDFDVVLSDFRMPMMDGQEFYKRAVKLKPSLTRRFVFLTGDVVSEDTRDFLSSTGNPHIAKPFQLNKVEEAVLKILREQAVAN
jgi:two-component system, NtrC family, sensor kinase